jgi:DNA modification methylase
MCASIQQFGFKIPILARSSGEVVDGHLRLKAALKLGIETVPVLLCDEWSETQVRAFRLMVNRSVTWADWDTDLLRLEIQDLNGFKFDLSLTGFDPEELLRLDATGKTDPEIVPPFPVYPVSMPGDLWVLGKHRLLCGDSTKRADVERLMAGVRAALFATDPPYLVDYTGMNHPSKYGESKASKNKDWSETYHEWDSSHGDGRQFYLDFYRVAVDIAISTHAAWYCWHASRHQAMVESVWAELGAFVHQQLIWAKSRPVLNYSVYMCAHEPCFFGWVRGNRPPVEKKVERLGEKEKYPTTIWNIPSSEVTCTDHPTSKPPRLFGIPMELHTEPGDICYEPFSGSGSQMIAAEQLSRRCFGIEQSPQYVDIAILRWQEFTGMKATLDGDCATFEEIAERRGKGIHAKS